ncbi:trigger factor [Candidatus Uhrbacteria bacterium]|nr:trigger factor [Candidatus Uhrbacteria bacterium]
MNEPILTKLPNSQVELKFVVTPEEAKPYLDQAATDLQTAKPIQGFRPGKAPYDVVKQTFGEMKIWEAALERIVRSSYVRAVLDHSLDTLGSPAISVEQLVPGQDIKFTATATVMPTLLTLAPYEQPVVTKSVRAITDTDVDKALDDLRKMRRQEVVTDRAATKDDLVVIDMEIKKDGVVVEGGSAKGYRIYLNEPHYIPGFSDELLGLKKGDAKTFTLTFPTEHYQKHLAGQPVEFAVTVTDVFELTLPELNDEFAKGLGIESAEKLRELVRTNMSKEAEQKADEASEIELIEKLVKGSKFSEVPELLVNEEVRKMWTEFVHAAEHQGMKMEDYLAHLKKTADQIKLDMVPRAIERIQAAVMMKEVAKREKIEVADTDIDAEIDRILSAVEDKETKERVSSPEYRDYVAAQMRSRKTVEILKKKGIASA